jgi:hypothetical protein
LWRWGTKLKLKLRFVFGWHRSLPPTAHIRFTELPNDDITTSTNAPCPNSQVHVQEQPQQRPDVNPDPGAYFSDTEPYRSYRKRVARRYYALCELVETEKGYLGNLRVLVEVS